MGDWLHGSAFSAWVTLLDGKIYSAFCLFACLERRLDVTIILMVSARGIN